jgi:1-acyl-sn-glycerol-3-phosphate acyltransferase/nucleoside-diphosphate-sugar epimerase
MKRVLVIDGRLPFERLLLERLERSPAVASCSSFARLTDGAPISGDALSRCMADQGIDTVVYSPCSGNLEATIPDLAEAATVLGACGRSGVRVVLLSSAAAYGASHNNHGLLRETRVPARSRKNRIASAWIELEETARRSIPAGGAAGDGPSLAILRPAPVLLAGSPDPISRMFRRRAAVTVAGYDPSLQLLAPDDLAEAVACAVEQEAGGVYNVAPGSVLPLRKALRAAGTRPVPLPTFLHRLGQSFRSSSADGVDCLRYSWTVSGEKIRRELGFAPRKGSIEALLEYCAASKGRRAPSGPAVSDPYGMDPHWVRLYGRTLFRFLARYYWRIETRGLENVPREGRAVLVGIHRGFFPWDGIMAAYVVAEETGRVPRFLIHPALIKFAHLAEFFIKCGGVLARRENAEDLLRRDELLGIYPEGAWGAFTLYRDAYRLERFGHEEYVRLALRHQAPIVPFVTLGSAETYPILGKIDWPWWKRITEWPFFPITPTFPLSPLPLPSKWHIRFLPPLPIERDYPPEAAGDPEIVERIAEEVRARIAETLEEMLRRRKSIFFGSIFENEAD